MKLYTEEQVREALKVGRFSTGNLVKTNNEIVESLTPIELPSDKEIHKQAINYSGFDNEFEAGAKWMRDKIHGGNR